MLHESGNRGRSKRVNALALPDGIHLVIEPKSDCWDKHLLSLRDLDLSAYLNDLIEVELPPSKLRDDLKILAM